MDTHQNLTQDFGNKKPMRSLKGNKITDGTATSEEKLVIEKSVPLIDPHYPKATLEKIISAQQRSLEQYIPLNLTEAYRDGDSFVLLDRLSLNALKKLDTTILLDEKNSGTTYSGNALPAEKMKNNYQLMKEEVCKSQDLINTQLAQYIVNKQLRQDLIAISPIYIGPEATSLNEKITTILINMYRKHGENHKKLLSRTLRLFKSASWILTKRSSGCTINVTKN